MMNNNKNNLDLNNLPQAVKEHISQLERVRQDFVANVSHELRTPLTVIRGYLETLCHKSSKDLEPYQSVFQQMHQHSVRMENILGDLLLLSRLESEEEPSDKKQDIDVSKILQALSQDANNFSGDKEHIISLEVDPDLHISGCEQELQSVFSNLIINAVKYTPANGVITIKWFRDKNLAVFSVTDTGIGIAQKHIPRITERFYRVDKARSRASGGTGLGLAIVKHVLMRHQSELSIQSTVGQGSTFTCKFPINTL